MSLLVVGVSHRSAPVSVLERAALDPSVRGVLLRELVGAPDGTEPVDPAPAGASPAPSGDAVREAAVVSTCNRIEVYADVARFHGGVADLTAALSRHSGVPAGDLTPHLYVHYEDRAVQHLYAVACGLDSMVVGEGQILGQLKDALALAQEHRTAGRLLNDVFQQALRVGKRAHSETGIDRAGQSLVTFGLEQLADGQPVADWVAGKRALVVGAGSMSALAATTLARAGVSELVIVNRTLDRAERLAEGLNGSWGAEAGGTLQARAVPINAISVSAELALADLVVSCTGAAGLVLTADEVAKALAGRPALDRTVRGSATPDGSATPGGAVADGTVTDGGAAAPDGTATDATDAAPSVDTAPSVDAGAGPARPVALLDLAMPRDIDAAVHRVPGARLVDIESLADAAGQGDTGPIAADVVAVRDIVAEEVAAFGAAQRAERITPTVVALRSMASDVVTAEMARLEGRLPGLDERQRAEITRTVRRVVDKLLHSPTVRVKELAGEPGGADYAVALRELFDLDPHAVAALSNPEQERP